MVKNIHIKVEKYIEDREKLSSLSGIKESLKNLWFDLKIWEWLKKDKDMLEYAKLFLKEETENTKRTTKEELKILKLEIKLRFKCSYFADFKEFLKNLKESENSTEKSAEGNKHTEQLEQEEIANNTFLTTPISQIKSHPYYKSSKSGVTRCSATAQFNWDSFGLKLPKWDAYKAGKNPWAGCLATIPSNKKTEIPKNSWKNLSLSDFTGQTNENINFADIYTNSKSWYWHRVVWFKDSDGQWYVLDPYTNVNWLDDKPKKLEDYMWKRKIKKIHFYQSDWYKFENAQYV